MRDELSKKEGQTSLDKVVYRSLRNTSVLAGRFVFIPNMSAIVSVGQIKNIAAFIQPFFLLKSWLYTNKSSFQFRNS